MDLIDDVLCAISFSYTREPDQRKWFIDRPINPIARDKDREIFDEFFDKDSMYSQQQQAKHLYKFDKLSVA